MLSFVTSLVATVAVAVAATFGYQLKAAEDIDNPIREWKDRGALCDAPPNARAAPMCALLDDEQTPGP